MFKKIITSIILSCFIFVNAGVYFVNTAHAQENTWYFQNYEIWHERVYDNDNPEEIFGERYTAAQVEWVIYGIFSFILNHMIGNEGLISCIIENRDNPVGFAANCGDDIYNQLKDWFTNDDEDVGAYLNSSSTGLANSKNPLKTIISGDRPISGIGYVRNAISKFNPVKEARAQGFGFEAAGSIRQLWVTVRNVTYFFLILMIVGMAFLIMFRFKINPQTVITVQSALPKIIGALILITFSYAIAGLMIDLMYVVIGILAAIFSQSGLFDNDWTYMYEALSGVNFGQGIIGMLFIYMFLFIAISFFSLFSTITGIILLPVTLIIWIILIVIAVLAILFILVKVMWTLIKTFVTTLLLIVVGPVMIITGGFTGWLKNLASNLAVFIAVGPMLALAFLFLANALPDSWELAVIEEIGIDLTSWISSHMPFHPETSALGGSSWTPPFLPFGAEDTDILWLIASFVVITLVPNVANMIKSAVQGKPFGFGTAIGAAVGSAAGVAAAPFAPHFKAYYESQGKEIAAGLYKRAAESRLGRAVRLPTR